jgi:DNA-directed RNA polymerase
MYWKQFDVSQMRKRVKRGVMTLPYGVTKQGIADQAINDGFCVTKDRSHADTQQQAAKFKDCLWDAMADAAPKAMELRAGMIECVGVLCGAGVAPTWTTPTGTEIIKAYRKPTNKQVMVNGLRTWLPSYSNVAGTLDTKKNKAAIVANLIHSFDAAMLQDTVVRILNQSVGPVSFVHDSYGCTAGDMELMNAALREAAYDMYVVNQMEVLRDTWQSMVGTVLPSCPEVGSMRVEEVLKSPYFFA